MSVLKRPIAIYYEHPHWFDRLFAELDRRGTPYEKVDATCHLFDVEAEGNRSYSLLFNRMSPSAYTRGHGHGIYYTVSYLEHLERLGTRVINGSRGFRHEISKALQLSLLHSLGLPYPRARVINHPKGAPAAAKGFRFPVILKPNVGGSGKGIVRFDTPETLAEAAENGQLSLGLDNTALVQEFIPAQDGHITRVEVVGGKYLYGINVHITGETFDLCPADICKTTAGVELNLATCAVEAPKAGLRVEAYTPPQQEIHDIERIMQNAGIDVGGVEYVVDARDGQLYFYDINALSNFVSDGPRVVGFDPFVPLVDYLEQQAQESLKKEAAA